MSNMLFKKVIAAASATAITLSVVAPVTNVSADSASIEAANKLAAAGVIKDQSSNPAAYNLDSEITRREMAKVMMNLSGLEVSDSCEGTFSDLDSSDWGCKYAEAALANGFVAANDSFNANANISKWESLKFILKAKGLEKAEGVEPFQKAYVAAAVNNGLIAEEFSDYNSPAVRSFIFNTASNTIVEEDNEDDMVEDEDDIFDDIFGEDDDEDTTVDEDTTEEDNTDEDDAPVISIDDDVLQVELSPMSPDNGERIPSSTPRVTMMVLDLTAGTDDVELNTIKLEAAGFGDTNDINDVVVYDADGEKISRQRSINSDDEVELDFLNEFTVKAGETVTLTVAANVEASQNGDVYALNVVELEATSDVDGAPIEGPELEAVTISNQGVLVIKANEATSDIEVGDEAKLAGIKVKNDNDKEDILLKTIRLQQTGSIDEDYITDMYVEIDGEKVVSDLEFSKEYVTIVFEGEGFELPREKSSYYNIELRGTITGEPTKDVKFEIEDADDIYAVGAKGGYNTPVEDSSNVKFAGNLALSDTLKVEGAAIQVSFEKGSKDASNIDVDDFNFGTLTLASTSSDYVLEDYKIKLTVTNTDGNDLVDGDLLENIKLGGLSTDTDIEAPSPAASSATYDILFEDISLRKGESKSLPLTADVPKTVTKDEISYEFVLDFRDDKFILKDEDNNETYTKENEVKDIFSTYSGLDTRNVDVEGANLDVTVDSINNEEIVLGSSTATMFKGDIEASSAADVKINEIVFAIVEDNEVAVLEDVVAKATLTIGDETIETTDIDEDSITFDGLSEVIKAGSSNKTDLELEVQFRDADDNAITTGSADKVAFKIKSIEAEDNDAGTELTFDPADIDDATKDIVIEDDFSNTVTLSTSGSIEIKVDISKDDANVDQFDKARYVLAGSNAYKLLKLDMEADKENVQVKQLVFTAAEDAAGSDSPVAKMEDSIENVKLMKGSKVIANGNVSVNGTNLVIDFDDIDSFYVETEEETFYVVADVKGIDLDETNGNAFSGATFALELDAANSEFEGEDSSEDLTVGSGVEVKDNNTSAGGPNDAVANAVTVVAADVASIEVSKATTKPTEGQYFEAAFFTVNPASNSNLDASGDSLKAKLAEVTLDKEDFVFTGVDTATNYNVRIRNVDTDVLVSADDIAFNSGATTITIDQGTADDLEIDGTTKFAIEVEITATSVDVDSSYSIKVDREAIRFTDSVDSAATAGGTAITTFNKLYKSGAVVSK